MFGNCARMENGFGKNEFRIIFSLTVSMTELVHYESNRNEISNRLTPSKWCTKFDYGKKNLSKFT